MDGKLGDVPYLEQGMRMARMNSLSQRKTNMNVRNVCKWCVVSRIGGSLARTLA